MTDGCRHRVIESPSVHVVLYEPEIPANTGNIGRLCGAAEITLHLIHPLGFRVDDRHLRRAGLDYWPEIDVRHHESFSSFLEKEAPDNARLFGFSRHAIKPYTHVTPRWGDYLLFGPETRGLPEVITSTYNCLRVPIWGSVRSLNLSTCTGIAVYHWLHAMGRF